MSYSRKSMTKHSSRFTDGEFQPNQQRAAHDNLLTEYLCLVRNKNEIQSDEYKEYARQQLDQMHEINATLLLTKLKGKTYRNVFLTVKIEHVATEQEFYAIPACDIEHRTQFQSQLNDTYTEPEFCEPFHEIKVKQVCAAYVDENWCRGEIVDIVDITGLQAMVYLLDYGQTIKVNRKHLCMLKYAHAPIRPFVIKCQLSILNGSALNSERRKQRLFEEFQAMANETKNVCIYLNEPKTKNSDFYANVMMLTDIQRKVKRKRSEAYSLHEAYGVFCRSKIQLADKMCQEWFKKLKIMENGINSNITRRVHVFLSHIESPVEFYVQCEAARWFMSKIRRIIDGCAIAQLTNFDFNGVHWKTGDMCLVRLQNWNTKANLKLWYRGRIIAIVDGSADDGLGTTYKVFLRDYGRRAEVKRMDLMTMSPELAACSDAVQKCTLAISWRWTSSGKDLFEESIAKYRCFAISRVKESKTSKYVDLWASNSSSPDVNEFDDWDNIGYTIICTAIQKSMQPFILETQHMYNVSKLSHDDGTSSKIFLSSDDDELIDKMPMHLVGGNDNDDNRDDIVYMIKSDLLAHEPIVKKWRKPVMFERNLFRGMVTHITKRGVIYVQEEANYELAHDISTTITGHCLKIRHLCSQHEWKTGDTCFAEYEENQYHRAVIKRIYREQGTCLVKYVDYGTKEIQKLDELQLATMFKDIPILVHRCFIPKLKSTAPTGQWSSAIFREFNKKILHEFCTIRIVGDVDGYKHNKYLPCSIDPIYQPQHAYNWVRSEKLVIRTGIDDTETNDEILYVG